jgi:hypothetical protein
MPQHLNWITVFTTREGWMRLALVVLMSPGIALGIASVAALALLLLPVMLMTRPQRLKGLVGQPQWRLQAMSAAAVRSAQG